MPKRRDRVILDTNLWISFLINNDFSRLDRIINDKKVVLLYSQELIEEFIEVARRPKFKKYFDEESLQLLLAKMAVRAEFIDVESKIIICQDPKDNFLLALAKDGKATHLLTGDKELLVIAKFSRTIIISMTEYLKTLT
jgi:putative PIN family toxin of toxin-antitoxin system